MRKMKLAVILFSALAIVSCKKDEEVMNDVITDVALDPASAPRQSIDRFSSDAGTLMVRDGVNGLPQANTAINFDQAPFITEGLGPDGQSVEYYNFDVMSLESAPIYVLFKVGSSTPVSGQLNLVDVIPGNSTYNDFWHVVKVTVPADYVANTVTSVSEIFSKGYSVEQTNTIVNCPIVPEGSTATKRYLNADNGLTMGWYNDKVVFYFNFSEAELMKNADGEIPLSPIYVSFNINPDQPNGGPSSGFMTESGTSMTHNVIFTIPGDNSYSPLWSVNVYDNADFNSVMCSMTAAASNVLGMNVATVNCPVVAIN